MANLIPDPVMGLLIPTPSVDPGPDYANNVSTSMTTIAQHTHTGASHLDGYQIPTAGLNINTDLSFQSNNATSIRSSRYISQSSTLSGSGDVNCVYDVLGNLYFNNGSGIPVQVTAGSQVNVTTSNNYSIKDLNTNYTIQTTDGYVVFNVIASAGAIVTLPLANSVPAGRFYIIKDGGGNAYAHNITINTAGSDTIGSDILGVVSTLAIKNNYGAVTLIGDGVSSWLLFKADQNVFGSGEELEFLTGSTLSLQTGSTLFADGYVTLDISNSSSSINLTNLGILTASSDGYININSGGFLNFGSGSNVTGFINWPATSSAAGLGQNLATTGNGHSMVLQAQSTSDSTGVGGPLELLSGTSGASATSSSYVIVQGTDAFYPWGGTANTQLQEYLHFYDVYSTPSSSSSVYTYRSIPFSNNSSAIVEFQWIRRPVGGGTPEGNRAQILITCGSSGAMGSGNSLTSPVLAYTNTSTGFSPNTDIIVSLGTKNILVCEIQAPGLAYVVDWQIITTLNFC